MNGRIYFLLGASLSLTSSQSLNLQHVVDGDIDCTAQNIFYSTPGIEILLISYKGSFTYYVISRGGRGFPNAYG